MPQRMPRAYPQHNVVPNVERNEEERVIPPRMRRLGHGLPLEETTDRWSPPRTTEDGREVRRGLFAMGG